MTLKICDLTSGYQGSRVVSDLNLSVEPGEVVALLGRNGMGKSTFAQTVTGLLDAKFGSILLDEENLSRKAAPARYQAGLRYIRQERPVVHGLSLKENLALCGVSTEEAAHYFEFIRDRSSQDTATLSGGEQKLLALARTFADPGKYWVLDEPTEGLQPLNVDRSAEFISSAAQSGVGVILIEQHLSLAMRIANRWVIIEKGQIVAEGEPNAEGLAQVKEALAV